MEPAPRAPDWILYDGRCGLCDRSVSWLLARDRRGAFRFATLKGAIGAEIRARHPDLPDRDETILLVLSPRTTEERVYWRSAAVLRALARLGGLYRSANVLRLVPPPLRDFVYRWVARNRTRWFGRLDSCRIPTAAERERFLD